MPVKEKPVGYDLFQLDETCLQLVRDEYNLPAADSFLPILLDGTTCTLLEVRSETSRKAVVRSGTERYFLKQIPWYADDPALARSSHRLQQALAANGAPVADVLRTRSGSSWIELAGNKLTLFEFRPGRRYAGTANQVSSAAAVLPTIHECDISLPEATGEDWFTLVADHLELARRVVPESPDVVAAVECLGGRLDLLRAAADGAGWRELADVPVHGDINPWNFLFDADGAVLAVVDFDNCDLGKRVRDVGEGALTFAAMSYAEDSTTFDQPLRIEVDRIRLHDFLQSYQKFAEVPITGDELTCLDIAFRLTAVELVTLGLIRGEIDATRDLPAIRQEPAVLPSEVLR